MFEQEISTKSLSDETLFHRVLHTLDQIEPLQLSRLPILVQVQDGVVTLSGAAGSPVVKAQTLEAVRGVLGVQQVRDKLLTDADLQERVMRAIAADPRTRAAAGAIAIDACNGQVALIGQVSTSAIVQAAEEIARSQPGVRAVSNRLWIEQG